MKYKDQIHPTNALVDSQDVAPPSIDILVPIHEKARHLFFQSEWPSKSNDEYRRTDLSTFPFTSFIPHPSAVHVYTGNVSTDDLLSPIPSPISRASSPEVLIITPLVSPENTTVSITSYTLLQDLESANNKVQFWHFANIDSGCTIITKEHLIEKEPVFLVYDFSDEDALYSPHTVIHAKEGSEVNVVIIYRSSSEASLCVNAGTSVFCGNNASVTITEIQLLSRNASFFSHGTSYCSNGSRMKRNDISLGGKLVKTRFSAAVRGHHADIELKGLFISSENQHQDIRVIQRHESVQSKSRSLYRGLVRDQGRSVFQGMISVDRNASGTDAYLSNDNLVLNDGARADSIPALHIDTNDVKCSHGSTTGKIDKNKLFYLMTRGFDEKQARNILINGFFEKIVDDLPTASADLVRACIDEKLSVNQNTTVAVS
jgi:Fe-S cluster assembly protein SufD